MKKVNLNLFLKVFLVIFLIVSINLAMNIFIFGLKLPDMNKQTNNNTDVENFTEKYGQTENLNYSLTDCLQFYGVHEKEKLQECRNTPENQNITG